MLKCFIEGDADHSFKHNFQLNGQKKSVNLHKAIIGESSKDSKSLEGVIILIEDITETDLLEASLSHSERLASIGRLAAGVAHEIGNPITGIACLAQTIRDEYDGDELNNLAEQIIEQTNRTSEIVYSLVNFAHAGTNKIHSKNEIVVIEKCMQEASILISLDKKNKNLKYEISCDPKAAILGDSQRLLQVLVNLINNARDASQRNNKISLVGSIDGDYVKIKVTDQGVGIQPLIRDRIFDPFFTTKEAGEGTGLGLSLVFSIVEDLRGDIDIISPIDMDKGTGTQVVIRFPRLEEGDAVNSDQLTLSDKLQQPV